MGSLILLAYQTILNIVYDNNMHVMPIKLGGDPIQGPSIARMTSQTGIVKSCHIYCTKE